MEKHMLQSIPEFNSKDLKNNGFKVYAIGSGTSPLPAHVRRDFYKVCFVTGKSRIYYMDRSIELQGSCLFFANPYIPYASENISQKQEGYACLFSDDFLNMKERSDSLLDSPLFKLEGTPVIYLYDEQKDYISAIFKKMLEEQNGNYRHKDDMVRSSLHLIIHEALRIQPSGQIDNHKNAATRITSVFLELLERQFPVDNADAPLKLRTAKDFADSLSIHVNHLNRAVRSVTGKPTTSHISERIVSEAKALLTHTDWNIAEIGYSLGFEYPTYFDNYFKRIAGVTPKSFRN